MEEGIISTSEKNTNSTAEESSISTAGENDENGISTADSGCADVKDQIIGNSDDLDTKCIDGVFTCDVCSKMYKKKGCFDKHMKLHSNSNKLKSVREDKINDTKSPNEKNKGTDANFKPYKKNLKPKKPTKRGRPRKNAKPVVESESSSSDFIETDDEDDDDDEEIDRLNDEEGGSDYDFQQDMKGEQQVEDDVDDNERLQCKVCNRSFRKPEKLEAHMNVHDGERPFPCTICNKRFIRRDHLKAHIKRHSNPVRFSCDQCGESFKREDHLRYHTINNHGGTIYLNELKVFKTTERRNLAKTVLCEICGKGFVDQNRLKIHKKIHTDSKRYQCKYCQRSFSNSSNFNVHVRLHTGKNPYKCVVCGDCFRTSSKLKTHTRKHTNQYPFVCEVCGKVCGEKHVLEAHMQTHTDQKLHECSYCGKSFAHSSTLHAHIRLHTGSKPFVCQVCGHSFAQVSSLNYHKLTHTGEKPYTCHLCGNSYTRKTTLTTHLSKHAGTKLVKCTLCEFTCYTAKQRKKHMSVVHNISSSTSVTKSTDAAATTINNIKVVTTSSIGDDFNLKLSLQSSTSNLLQPLTSSTVGDQFDFNGQVIHSNTTLPAYYNPGQSFVNLSDIAHQQSSSMHQFSTTTTITTHNHQQLDSAISQSHTDGINSNAFTPAPAHNHASSTIIPSLSSTSSGYLPNSSISHLSYPNSTGDLGSVVDPNILSMNHNNNSGANNNGVNFSTKALPTFSPSLYFDQVSLPNNSGQSFAPTSTVTSHQNQSHFSNAPHNSMMHGKPYEHLNLGQKMPNESKRNIWLTIGTSSSKLAQNQRNATAEPTHTSIEHRNISNVSASISGGDFPQQSFINKSSTSTLDMFRDLNLIHKATVSAQIISEPTIRQSPTDDGDDDLDSHEILSPSDNLPADPNSNPTQDNDNLCSNTEADVDSENNQTLIFKTETNLSADNPNSSPEIEPVVADSCQSSNTEVNATTENTHDSSPKNKIKVKSSVDNVDNKNSRRKSKISLKPSKSRATQNVKVKTKKKSKIEEKKEDPLPSADDVESNNESDISEDEEEGEKQESYSPKRRERKRKKADSDYEPDNVEADENKDNNKRVTRRQSLRVKLMFRRERKPVKKRGRPINSSKGVGRRSSKKYAAKVTKVSVVKKNVKVKIEAKSEDDETHNDKEEDDDEDNDDDDADDSDIGILQRPRKRGRYKKHVKDEVFSCTDCDMKFSRPQYLKKHLNSHKKAMRYTCLYCLTLFDTKKSIIEHMHSKHPGKHPFSCNVCQFSCIDVATLKNHVKSLHYDIEYNCHICNTKFPKSKHLKDHMSKNHESSKAFVCQTCDKSFAECSLLVLHNKHKHSGVRAFKCNLCDKTLVAAAKLTNHLRAHTGERPYTCEFCGKLFAHLSLLNIHVKAHSSLKPFVCSYCGYSFTHKSTLKAHVRTHTGAKPFKCDLCDKSFAQLSSLNYHTKSHAGLKPFTCDLCGKSFTRSTTLKTHLMQHEGKKRFSCELCDFKCNRKHGMRKHHSKKHSGLESGDKQELPPPAQPPMISSLANELEIINDQNVKSDNNEIISNNIHPEYKYNDLQKHESVMINLPPPQQPPPSALLSQSQLLQLQPPPSSSSVVTLPQHNMAESSVLPALSSTLSSLLQLPPLPSTSTTTPLQPLVTPQPLHPPPPAPPQLLQQQIKVQSHTHPSHSNQQLHHHLEETQVCKLSEDQLVIKETLSVPSQIQAFFYPNHHHHHPHHQLPPPAALSLPQQAQHDQQQHQQVYPIALREAQPPMLDQRTSAVPPSAHSFITLQSLHHYHQSN